VAFDRKKYFPDFFFFGGGGVNAPWPRIVSIVSCIAILLLDTYREEILGIAHPYYKPHYLSDARPSRPARPAAPAPVPACQALLGGAALRRLALQKFTVWGVRTLELRSTPQQFGDSQSQNETPLPVPSSLHESEKQPLSQALCASDNFADW